MFSLRWPDFIEFDEMNGKIITKHSQEGAFRVWDLATYRMLFVVSAPNVLEFKVWYASKS